jgi:hypothetical protein
MQSYTHNYQYDELGNITLVRSKNQWTRDYYYNFENNNYLLGHEENKTEYSYDAHGNMTTMPHLKAMHWDNNDWLTHVELDESGNNAYYVYDGSGERVRKIV